MEEVIDLKVDVGILKNQIQTITSLCTKMDQVIEKLMLHHDEHISKVYTDMDRRRIETNEDIKDLHERIDVVLDKVQDTEKNLLEAVKELRKEMQLHNSKERESLDKLLQWKWTIVGALLVISWLLSHVNYDTLAHSIAPH